MNEKNKNIASAKAKSLKTSITKVNLVLKMIRGKKAENALNILAFSKRRISNEITKILKSAIANAENNNNVLVSRLRRGLSSKKIINFWCVSDNLLKGAALNAVQIASCLVNK